MTTQLILYKRPYNPHPFQKKICAVHRTNFSRHLLFTPFSLLLTVSEVCNISNKNWLPYKSSRKTFFYTTPHLKKGSVLHRRSFQKHLLFTTFSLFLIFIEVWYISNILTKTYFYGSHFTPLLNFKKRCSP